MVPPFAKILYLTFVNIVLVNSFPFVRDSDGCGYGSCNPVKDGYINVHLIPHTHDDVGWLKNVAQYYYGSKNDVQRAGVQYILDTVVDSLRKNETRKFMYVETAFFWKWWLEQNDEQKEIVRRLVNNGQLQFAGGGWSMNDEGATNYQSIIDQMTWGLRKLDDIFGDCGRPKVGWQIDPFGHSKGMAYVFALLGYDAFLLNRIDYQDFDHRRETKTLEMVWRSSANLGQESSIFTSVLPKHYNPPPGFCFDINCNDEPIIDDPTSPDNNVEQRVNDFISFLDDTSSRVATNNVLITMGDDFTYQDADTWYKNIDKLIKYTNERQESGSKYNLLYSTASCYVKAVYDETKGKVNWSMKYDDFLPFADGEHALLTGYYTSRPTLKKFEREGNNFLQICKQLSALTNVNPNPKIDYLKEAMGAMEHHDAITGTEKQAVAQDYNRMLALGMTHCEDIASDALSILSNEGPSSYETCRLTNISQCALTESEDKFVVTVYNPLSRPVSKVIRLPVLGTQYSVRNSDGEEITSQLQPIPTEVQNIPGRESESTVDIIFEVTDIPPLGFESLYVERLDGYDVVQPTKNVPEDKGILIDENTGLISHVTLNGMSIPLTQKFAYYQGFVVPEGEPYSTESGAYVFRPIGPSTLISETAEYTVYDGPIVTEIHQIFNEWVSQIIRVYANEPYIEFSWLVGPIPDDQYGKEVVSRFNTELRTNSTFYTDSNGRELLKRIKDFRPTWDIQLTEKIAGNYYPVTSKIVLRDEENNAEFSILTDRSEAGSSLNEGEIELMVHRSCLGGDAFGETLQEEAFGKGLVARGSQFVVYGNIVTDENEKTIAAIEKDVAQRKLLDSWVFLSSTNGQTFKEYKERNTLKFAGLERTLPENVQILTLEPWKESKVLLRLEHIFEIDEHPVFSQPVTVDLKDLFSTFKITAIEETTLGGNQLLSENQRLYFDESDSYEHAKSFEGKEDDIENLEITINPMQIRTFVATIESIR